MPETTTGARTVAFSANIEIVKNDDIPIYWDVIFNGEKRGGIGINSFGEFNVCMQDGIDTYSDEWPLDSLRKASAWVMRYLVTEEIEKGW